MFARRSHPLEEREIDALSDGFRQIERFRFCGHIHRRRFPFTVSQNAAISNEKLRLVTIDVPDFFSRDEVTSFSAIESINLA